MNSSVRWSKSPHDDAMNVVRPYRLVATFPAHESEQYYTNEQACRNGLCDTCWGWRGANWPSHVKRERYLDGQWVKL